MKKLFVVLIGLFFSTSILCNKYGVDWEKLSPAVVLINSNWDAEVELGEAAFNTDETVNFEYHINSQPGFDIAKEHIQKYKSVSLTIHTMNHQMQSDWQIYLPGDFFVGLSNVIKLNLHDCYFKVLPESIGDLTNLKVLNLSGNMFDSLPKSLGNLINLEQLNASHNKLTQVGGIFGKLKKLKKLRLSDNALGGLPADLGNLKLLKMLYLNDNYLKAEYSKAIVSLTNLLILDLSNNGLTSLPDLSKLTKLFELKIQGNKLTSLPSWLLDLPRLKKLDIKDNSLKVVPELLLEKQKEGKVKIDGVNQQKTVPVAFFKRIGMRISRLFA